MLRLERIRKLSVSATRLVSWNGSYHPRVCWATNEMVGRHPRFSTFPDPRIPSAALLEQNSQKSWRKRYARKPMLWKNRRRRKYNIDYATMPQRYDELCEFSITLVEHDELMPKNYVRFHIPREMTKYELFNYLDKLYGVKMSHIDLEARMPMKFDHENLDHPENKDAEHYSPKFHIHDGNSPDYYGTGVQGYGWADNDAILPTIMRETDGYCIAHCFLPRGESFNFPDLFNRRKGGSEEDDVQEMLKDKDSLGKKFRIENNLDTEGTNEQLALKAFSNFNFFAGIQPSEYNLRTDETQTPAVLQSMGSKADQREFYEKELILVESHGDEEKKHHLLKSLDILNESDRLTEKVNKLVEEHTAGLQLITGYEQKGQDTYRNNVNNSTIRNVKFEIPEGEAVPDNLPETMPISYKMHAELIKNAPIVKMTKNLV